MRCVCLSCWLQVVMVFKKEIMKTQNKDFEKGGEYRQMLVQVRAGLGRRAGQGRA